MVRLDRRLTADPAQIVDAALKLRDAGRSADAAALVEAGLMAHPRHAPLWQVSALLHRAAGDSPEATRAFARAAELAPRDVRIAHGLARATLEAGSPAVALFDRARLLAPVDGELLIGRAAAQLAEGQGAQAIADLDTVLAGNPLWLDGQATLARLRWLAGDRDAAAAGYRRALAQEGRALPLWTALLDFLLQTERFAEADAAIAAARGATGADLDTFEAVTASELRDDARAERLFAALGGRPDTAVAVRHVRHLLRTGRPDAAVALLEPLLDRPDADQAWPYAALAWRLTGDPRWDWLERDERLVGVYDLQLPLDALAARLRALHGAAAAPVGQSVRGGTQTDGPLFARAEPEIRALREAVRAAVSAHVAAMGPSDPRHPVLRHAGPGVRFAGSWSVRLVGDAAHHSAHIHPAGWLSSACYIVVPDADELGPPPAGHLLLGQPPAELGLDLRPFRTIEPRPGRLVLFPSLLWHGTGRFAQGDRISVAFDVGRPRVGLP